MKKNWKKWLSTALFLTLIVLLCLYVYQEREEMGRLLQLNAPTVALMLVLALGGCIMNCIYHRILLSGYQIDLDLTDWMGVVFSANAIAYVLPMRADLVFSAAYYKRTKHLAYVKSVSMAAGNVIFGIIFALLQMLAALICTAAVDGHAPMILWVVWGIGTACVAAFLVLSLLLGDKRPKLLTRFHLVADVVDGFNALLKNRPMLMKLLLCLLINNTIQLCLYIVCFHAIGMEITFYQALFYNAVSWISTVISIVPGNVGIKEAIMGVSTALMGTMFQNGVAVSLLQRVSFMIVYIIGGAVWGYPVYRKWNQAEDSAPVK